jgi:hypothetical protein
VKGLWIWIWELAKCEEGNVPALLAKAKRVGAAGVILKCGENGPGVEQVTPALVKAFADAGIGLAVWWYCRPWCFDGQIAMLKAVRAMGVTAFVMDAEKEWDAPDQRVGAGGHAQRIRAALGPDVFLADAPWSRPKKHGGFFPYAEFGAVMNARCPQFYWELAEVAGEPQAPFLADCDAEWAETDAVRPICPALCSVNEDGSVHAPVSELAYALDRYARRDSVSIWSWQHLSAAEWALLEKRAAAAPPAAPISDPLASVPTPGLLIPGANA